MKYDRLGPKKFNKRKNENQGDFLLVSMDHIIFIKTYFMLILG